MVLTFTAAFAGSNGLKCSVPAGLTDRNSPRRVTLLTLLGALLALYALPAQAQITYSSQRTDFYSGLRIVQGVIATEQPGIAISQEWNNGGVIFRGLTVDITDTASAVGSEVADFRLGGATMGKITATGQIIVKETGQLGINHRLYIHAPEDGGALLTNEAANDFNCIALGGTTSGHPALCRSNVVGSFLEARTGEVGITAYTSILGNAWVSVGGISNFASATVASAASLTPTANVMFVTGTTGITSIGVSGVQSGTCITLAFAGILTMVDGGNLKMEGNFTTSADDTWSGCTDGTSWLETSRKVN